MMRRLMRILLILAVMLYLVTEIQNSPIDGTALGDATHTNKSTEDLNADNANSDIVDPRSIDPVEMHDGTLYNSDLQSEEENLSDAEFGQELIDFLLRTGKIREKTTSPLFQNTLLARRHEQMKNDRYDELIAAFNVILEEIVLQGSTRSLSNHINTDGDSVGVEQPCKSEICTKNVPSTDRMNRCLSQLERELLQKIKLLTNQLNSVMKKRNNVNNNEDLNNDF